MRPESWESVARTLARRLVHHADVCPEVTSGGPHNPDDHAGGCPYCADTVAYRRFVARSEGRAYVRSTTEAR